ncbi:MAG: glycosyltransferase family 4 protein [Acidobacteriia bacterium]|nr:glycosyltransferase family 4 protein [Terriglobia bacterium]
MRIIYHHRTRSTDAQRVHIQEMVEAFRALGHKVKLVSLVPTDTAEEDARRDARNPLWQRLARRIPFAYEAVQLAYNLIGIPMLAWEALRDRADLLYERYSLFNFTGVAVAKLCGIPIVLEVNSPFALEQGRERDIRLVRFAAWTERAIANLASRAVVVSTPLARILEGSGVEGDRIDVMTNGVRLEHFVSRPQSDKLRASLGLKPGERVIGFVGWFRRWHGIEMLLDAFQSSGLASERVRLMLVGGGQAMNEIEAYVREKQMGDSVIFTGPVPHANILEYLDLIHIAVQPAANEYCCPMKILEYMALGKPIVAPRQKNIQEILRDGVEARFFTPRDTASLADALRAVAQDAAMARWMGERARAAISERGYLWTRNAERVLAGWGAEELAVPVVEHQ